MADIWTNKIGDIVAETHTEQDIADSRMFFFIFFFCWYNKRDNQTNELKVQLWIWTDEILNADGDA